MSTTIVTITTPGDSQVTIDANVSGDTTIECWGQGGNGYAGLYYGGGGGGEFVKRSFTLAGNTLLDCHVPVPGGAGLAAATVFDHATSGTHVTVQAINGQDPGGDGNSGGDQGGGGSSGDWASGSVTHHKGGNGGPNGESVASGGGSSGCPTADGNNASGGTGGTSAGTDSGAGGNGSALGTGSNGSAPGGGGGNGLLGRGNGARGQIRITYDVNPPGTPPTITSGSGATAAYSVAENATAVATLTASGDPTIVWTKTGGADQAKFTLTGAVLTFTAAPNFEVKTDADDNNIYEVQVTATNDAGTDAQAISVTVTNITAPANTAVPTLSGFTYRGYTLTSTDGTWSGSTPAFTYQWKRSDTLAGSYSNIADDSTAATYVPIAADDGKYLRCYVTATNSEGAATANSVGLYILPVVSAPGATPIGTTFPSLAGFADEYLITDHTLDDTSDSMEADIAYDAGTPQANYDLSFHSLANSDARTNTYGATLISPSFVTVATHAAGDGSGYEWRRKSDNAAVIRVPGTLVENVNYWNVDGDLTVIKLPTPILDIEPAKILDDSSDLAGKTAVAIEADYHFSLHTLSASLDNTDPVTVFSSGADIIEGGDSGKPLFVIIGSTPVIALTGLHTATSGPNPSHYIAELSAIVAHGGEQLTLVGSGEVPTTAPRITGFAKPNFVLTVTDGTWSEEPIDITYQWLRKAAGVSAFTNISGATSASYTPRLGDLATTITADVTAELSSETTTARADPVSILN